MFLKKTCHSLLFFAFFIGTLLAQSSVCYSFGSSESGKESNKESVKALDTSNFILSDETIEKKIGEGWAGILFICDPYCKFISLRESQVWNPPLIKQKIRLEDLKFIGKTDPLYPLLITQITGQSAQELDIKKNDQDKLDEDQAIPKYAEAPFEFGYAVNFGISKTAMTINSNTQILSELNSTLLTGSNPLRITLMKGSPVHFLKNYWQLQLSYFTEKGPSATTKSGKQQISPAENEIQLNTIAMRNGYKLLLGLSQSNSDFTTDGSSLTLYSFKISRQWIKAGLIWKRFLIRYDYALSSNINETQNYRTAPFEESTSALHLSYQSKNFTAFDIDYGLYVLLQYSTTRQLSKINPNLFISDNSVINSNINRIEFGVRFGEDLLK